MTKQKDIIIPQEAFDWYDEYAHGDIDRRTFLTRLGKGFVAFAPDILHTLGGYPGNDDEGKAMQASMDRAKIELDFIAAAEFLNGHELSSGKVGVVGFCFGGYISNMLAATIPDTIDAAVPFYGTPAKSGVENIKAPLMIQFAELDKRVNATWPDYEAALKANNIDYQTPPAVTTRPPPN